jgi:hypothetical protein
MGFDGPSTSSDVTMDLANASSAGAAPRIPFLPNEIYMEVFSHLVKPEITLSCNREDVLEAPPEETCFLRLRLVSRSFRDMVDSLVYNPRNFPADIYLRGGIPLGDPDAVRSVHAQYKSVLLGRMDPFLESAVPICSRIHLQPELTNLRDVLVWEHAKVQTSEMHKVKVLKDSETVQNTMTDHQAAAMMLSKILYDIDQDADENLHFRLVFHELDGTCSNSQLPRSVTSTKAPTVMPFWYLDAVRHIIGQWAWLCEASAPTNTMNNLSTYITLPTIAYTTDGQRSSQAIYWHCYNSVVLAWLPRPRGERLISTASVRVRLPGFGKPVCCAQNRLLSEWLTTLGPTSAKTRCFAVQRLGVDTDDDENGVHHHTAYEMPRPRCLTAEFGM